MKMLQVLESEAAAVDDYTRLQRGFGVSGFKSLEAQEFRTVGG